MSYFILMGRRIPKQAITGFRFQNETDNIRPFLSIRIRGKEEIIPLKDKREILSVKAHLCSIFSGFVKIGDWYLNRSYERLNVINEGVVPAVEGCVGYTNEEFERVNKENNDPESAKIGSFNKTVEEANNIRSRVLKYVDKIKQERAYNIDLCMTFERYIEIADKDAKRAMAFLKEAYPFNKETEVFIRKRYNMSIDVNPEEN